MPLERQSTFPRVYSTSCMKQSQENALYSLLKKKKHLRHFRVWQVSLIVSFCSPPFMQCSPMASLGYPEEPVGVMGLRETLLCSKGSSSGNSQPSGPVVQCSDMVCCFVPAKLGFLGCSAVSGEPWGHTLQCSRAIWWCAWHQAWVVALFSHQRNAALSNTVQHTVQHMGFRSHAQERNYSEAMEPSDTPKSALGRLSN